MKVFVAETVTLGLMPGDHSDCVDGELCWVLPPCANASQGCDCWSEFQGASTEGRTTSARVTALRDSSQLEILRTLRDAAEPLLGPVLAQRAAEATIGAAAVFPDGIFVMRDHRGVRPRFCAHHQRELASGARWNGDRRPGR